MQKLRFLPRLGCCRRIPACVMTTKQGDSRAFHPQIGHGVWFSESSTFRSAGLGFGVGVGLGTISICWRLFRKSSRNRFSSSDDWVKLRNGFKKIRSKSAGTKRPRIRDLSLPGRKISKRCSFESLRPLREVVFLAFFANLSRDSRLQIQTRPKRRKCSIASRPFVATIIS